MQEAAGSNPAPPTIYRFVLKLTAYWPRTCPPPVRDSLVPGAGRAPDALEYAIEAGSVRNGVPAEADLGMPLSVDRRGERVADRVERRAPVAGDDDFRTAERRELLHRDACVPGRSLSHDR